MSLKQPKHRNDTSSSKQRSTDTAIEHLDRLPQQKIHSTSIAPRVRLSPHSPIAGEVLQLQRIIGNHAVDRLLARTAHYQPAQLRDPASTGSFVPVVQRDILIGDVHYKPYNDTLIDAIYLLVKPYITQWETMGEIFQRNTRNATNNAITFYLDQDGENVNGLKNDVRAMLRKYNGNKTFGSNQDLARQVVQDVKLRLLGMERVIGVDNQDGQFSETADVPAVGRTGKTRTLRIYRTMSAANWHTYTQSNNLDDILHGHGGSLGQAMHYFAMSKRDAKDDVLVEFTFANTAQNLIDYTQISRGGEGGAPRNNKLTGKSEKNDVMQLDQSIFSINLSASKALIKQLNPQVHLIDRATA